MDACDGPQQSVAVTTIWQSFSKTFKVNTWTNAGYDFFDFGNIPGLYLYLYDLKIEKGTQATDWSIAQEDLQADLDIAKSQATLALQELDDIAADNKLTPLEKKTLSKDLNEAFNEVNVLISQANTYGVSYADYNTKYLSLLAYGNPLIANMNTVTDIVRATFVATFNAYYTAKISLLKLITDAAYGKIEGIQIGGRNYFKKTTSLQAGSGAKNIVKTDRGFNVIGVNENTALIRLVDVIKSNGYWTVSFDVSVNAVLWNSSKVEINDLPGAKQFIAPITPNKQHVEYTVNVTNWTDSVYNFIDFYDLSGQTYYFDNIKVEKGTKASDWTPAPEDVSGEAQAKADLAKSEAIVSANDFATTIATTKANAAQAAAQSAASSDAQTKANTAYNTALAASKTYADTAAGSAKSAAQIAAAADASTKATQAYNDAQAAANVKYNTLTSTLGNMAYRSIQAAAGQGVTVVDNGSVLTFLVDAAYVKANVINAGYLTGLELNFTKGTIGGLFIQNNGIASSNGNFSISSAGVLTATQANISGNVNATTGTIGGFSIGSNFMESATSYNGGKFVIYPNDGFIAFLNNDSGIWTGMGHNVMPAGTGITAVGRFENGRSNSGGTNIGLYINATGASNNYALEIVNGGIRVNGRKGLSGVAYCSNVGNNVYNGIEFRDGLAVASGQYNLSSRPPGLS